MFFFSFSNCVLQNRTFNLNLLSSLNPDQPDIGPQTVGKSCKQST